MSRIKLEVFGLDPYLDLACSAYGDDHTERPELVAIAQQRATERMAATLSNEAELTQAGAPVTVFDLTQTATVVRLVTDGLQTSAEQPGV